jgi:hypothetical protein
LFHAGPVLNPWAQSPAIIAVLTTKSSQKPLIIVLKNEISPKTGADMFCC